MSVVLTVEEVVGMLREEGILDLPERVDADLDLFAMGLDSMGLMQLIVAVEERFGVVLGAADATKELLGTPGKLAETIHSRR